ncbi:proprotein convertase P-domain-containing protein, partial [Tenacibaculum sp. FZY0031]|uniref:proprotein convertase P-domain-containing protein n=1 Tax=Tenacibaculum sp. FZY0031 TaxID=3116648 RepID=UPI002EA82CC1|nr:proprotein convertase P-domain-containing protein [Tenacibaculum sp. FZY0031]
MGENYIAKIGTYKKIFFLVLILLFSVRSYGQDCTIYSDNSGYSIPDSTAGYFDAAIVTVSDSFSITDLNVTININHTYNDDLDIRLVHRVGGSTVKTVILSTDNGGSGDGFINVTFDDSSGNSLPPGGNSVLTGVYKPEGNLDDFVGDNSLGDWVLQIRDDAIGDTGTLTSFSINICKLHEISCDNVYASTTSSTLGNRNSLYTLTGSTMTPVYTAPQRIGGLAVSADGNAYYDNASGSFPLYSSDGSTQVSEGGTLPNQLVGQGANDAGDVYYIDTSYHLRVVYNGVAGSAADLGALDFGTDTIGGTLVAGDLAFDGNGRLHWYASVGGSGASYLFIINTNTLVAQNLGNVGPNGATGVAFDSSGNMITSTSNGDGTSNIYSIDFSSPTLSGTLIGTASPGIYDMGSCSTPTYNPILSATKSVKNITKSADPAVIALSGDVLEYTIEVNNTGNLSASNTTFIDAIPASTTYVANSTQLNGASIADVSGNMPYTTATEIHSSTQPDGVVTIGSPVTITFRVTVDDGMLPATINNTGTVEYPIVTGGVTTNQSVDSNTVTTPTGDICTLGINDSDGDGIDDVCDLDDDNDGILDSSEGGCTVNEFTIFGGDGGSTTSFSQSAVSSAVFDFYYVDNSVAIEINGGGLNTNNVLQLQNIVNSGEVIMEFTSDNSLMSSPWLANTNGIPRLKVEIDFSGNITVYGSRSTSSTSLELMQPRDGSSFNTISFLAGINNFNVINQDGSGPDRIGGAVKVYSSCVDTDNDNIPDYLDTDSDGDGCFDAIEGNEDVDISDLSSGRITGGVDSDGVPNIVNSGGSADGTNNTQGQGVGTSATANADAVPTLIITNPASVCSPSTVDLTASTVTDGANGSSSAGTLTYWTDAAATNTLASPNSIATSGTYYIKLTSVSGCYEIEPVTITVNPLPTVTANASATTVCAGESVTLTGGGADSYVWDNGVNDGVSFVPTATTTYTVTGTDANGCENTAQVTITVNPLPTVTANASATTVCAGESV